MLILPEQKVFVKKNLLSIVFGYANKVERDL